MQQSWLKGTAAAAIAVLLVAGCGQKAPLAGAPAAPPATSAPSTAPSVDTDKEHATAPAKETPAAPKPEEKVLAVKAYYSDAKLEKLVEKSVKVTYKTDKEKYIAVLNSLKKAPDAESLTLFKGFTFKQAELKEGLLTVDLSMTEESRLGSGGEEMLLQSLQKTLFQFEEVKSIEVLLDGKQTDSLMGHMELDHPIQRQ
ncbi:MULTISPECIES: GerMN domain-containing protein [Paenibacillus]|uniref:GerMN domain-containing protein n=1 Tax=Paenibacillus TaxID=44249 RepID=UPI0022B8CFE6|nr:GerMN domain-containing protein [Paenibacillus caseinilyticus]MCZ8521416.1 GerMN domain-containing protein [Paenibacillus caseinilyticus]